MQKMDTRHLARKTTVLTSEQSKPDLQAKNRLRIIDALGGRYETEYTERGIIKPYHEALDLWLATFPKPNLLLSGYPGTGKTLALAYVLERMSKVDWLFWDSKKLATQLVDFSISRAVDVWDRGDRAETIRIPRVLILDDLNTGEVNATGQQTWTAGQVKQIADYVNDIEKNNRKTAVIITTNHSISEIKTIAQGEVNQGRLWRRLLNMDTIKAGAGSNSRTCKTCALKCGKQPIWECEKWRKK